MFSRWYDLAVVLLWLTCMGWLVAEKVLPALIIGTPPDSQAILAAKEEESLVGWYVFWNGRRVGWALNRSELAPGGLMEVQSRVHFDELPVNSKGPAWLRDLMGQLGSRLQLDLDNALVFDSLGRLSRFVSTARFPPSEEAAIKVQGSIDGPQLMLAIRSGSFNYETQLPAPRNAMMADAFSPQTHLPGLREGQTWSIAVYSPLQPPNPSDPKDPREILHAKVEGQERVLWGGESAPAWVVVYRSDAAKAAHQADKPVGTVWVRFDGVILKQEMKFFGSTISFVRLTEVQALTLSHDVQFKPQPEHRMPAIGRRERKQE